MDNLRNAAGDRLAIGAMGDDSLNNAAGNGNTGAVYLFDIDAYNFATPVLAGMLGKNYAGTGNLSISALGTDDFFGTSVAFNGTGDRLVVGARQDDGVSDALQDSGAVYLLTLNTTPATTFAGNPSGSMNIAANSLATSLAAGTNVVLQANNDITVNTAITVTGSPASVGALTLQAGRSILLNESITTLGGNVSLTANSTVASGVVNAQRDTGAAAITLASGKKIDAGTGAVTLLIDAGTGLTYSTSGDITLAGTITGSTISLYNSGPTAFSGIVLNSGAALTASGTGNALVLVGKKFTNMAGSSVLSATNGNWQVWSGTPSSDTVGGLAFDYKEYNLAWSPTATSFGTGNGLIYSANPTLSVTFGAVTKTYDTTLTATPGTLTLTGLSAGETYTPLSYTGAAFDTKAAGTGKTVTVSGLSTTITSGGKPVYGYTVPNSATNITSVINKASLAVSGVTANSKTYDGTTAATLSGTATVSALGNDVVSVSGTGTGTFGTKNVGTGKGVTVTGYTLSGADAANYVLVQPTGLTANISKANLAVSGITAASKTYDGTTAAPLSGTVSVTALGSDVVSVSGTGTGTFTTKNAGTGKTVTVTGYTLSGADAGNYALVQPTGLTANISAASLAVSGVTANSKTYDGTTVATLSGTASVTALAGDTVSVTGTGSASFATKGVGNGKTVTVTGYTLTGVDAANYVLVQPTGLTADVTARALTLTGSFSATDRDYDGTTAVVVDSGASGMVLAGMVNGDDVGLAGTLAGSVADKNVGTGKTVTLRASGLLAGGDADNYTLTGTLPTGTVNINRLASVTWTGAGGDNDWFNPANWAGGAVPDLANVASAILPAGTIVTFGDGPGSPVQLDSLLGGTTGGASLTMTGGALEIADDMTLAGLVQSGGSIGGGGSLTIAESTMQSGGTIAMGGDVSLTQESGDLSLVSVSGNQITLAAPDGTLALGNVTATGNLAASAAGDISLGATSVGGNLLATSTSGDISQTGPLAVTGTTGLNATGNIALNDASNALTGTVSAASSTGSVGLVQGTGPLVLGTVSGSTVNATASNGAVNTTGTISATGNVALGGSSGVSLGANVTSGGAFSANGGSGAISQPGGTLAVSGTTSLTSVGNIALTDAGNALTGTVSAASGTGSVGLVQGTGPLVLGTVSGSTVNATASNGAVNTAGTISATGNVALSGSSGVSLGANVTSGGAFSANGGSGAISQTGGTLAVSGSATLTAAGAIALTSPDNKVSGDVSSTSQSGQVNVSAGAGNAMKQQQVASLGSILARHEELSIEISSPYQALLQDDLERIGMFPIIVQSRAVNIQVGSAGSR